jgi:hypothetical protein
MAEWLTALGELAIAVVIWWEMEENRRERFQTEAAKIQNYEDRGRIYAAYYDTAGASIRQRSEEFCRRIWREQNAAEGEVDLKTSCERQIVLFNRLGQISRRALFYKNDYLKLFPHAVVLFWIMLGPYIAERRAMTGNWWASDFEELTRECLKFLFKADANAHLTLYDRNRERGEDLTIPTTQLRDLQAELSRRK